MIKKIINNHNVIGADIGKNTAKIASINGVKIIPSYLYPYRELHLKSEYGTYDFEIEYKGNKYLGGYLGEREGEVPLFNSDTSKNHEETLIVLLCALSTFEGINNFKVVIGSPVSNHNHDEKEKIKEKFKGEHEITINGELNNIVIDELEIAPEGASAFWNNPRDGIVRILDFGSTTVNYATLKNRRYVDKESGTFPIGINTMKTDMEGVIKGIYTNLKNSWNENDYLLVVGGGGYEAIKHLPKYYPESDLLENCVTATAEGFLYIARALYE